MSKLYFFAAAVISVAISLPAAALTLDGQNIPSEGLTLLTTQDSPTGYGNATGGAQNSAGGSELDQMFADIVNGKLELGITGNLEGNYNKMWIFFDAVDGGENILAGDNQSGGFNQISGLTGLTFPTGVTMDHGLELEVGDGFYGVRFFDLITNTAVDVATGGGYADFPLSDVTGAKGVDFGWNNANVLGVDGESAADASTATSGFEFQIDLLEAFNGSQGDINIVAMVSNGNGDHLSNQILPGINGSNPGTPSGVTLTTAATVSGPIIAGALLGDVDNDGDVDLEELASAGDGLSDFDIIRMNWLETNDTFGATLARSDGDLNENGEVSIEDFREWKTAYLAQGGLAADVAAAFASLGSTTVPEPSSVVLVALAAAGLLVIRRR